MHAAVVSLLAGLVALYFGLRQWLWATQDSREPPVLETRIPFVTPVVGMLKGKTGYYDRLRDRFNLPIYTLRLPGSRIYVINTPQLITAVQKNFRVLNFQTMTDKFSGLICDTSQHAKDVQKQRFDEWAKGDVAESGNHKSYKVLSPGVALDDMNRTMIGTLAGEIGKSFKEKGDDAVLKVGLYQWMRDIVTIATTDGVYGDKNPYRDPTVAKDYWTYESSLALFAIGLFPTLLARPAHLARTRNTQVFTRFFEFSSHLSGSPFTIARYAWHRSAGFTLIDTARLEVGNGIAMLSNTVPTAFWTLYHILSSPTTLDVIRTEVSAHVKRTPDGKKFLDLVAVKNDCPLLFSSLKEAMRLHSLNSGMRSVLEDTMLNGTYLLKKGSMVMMPSTVQHSDGRIWGDDVDRFNHARFANTTNNNNSSRPIKANPVSFRAFGGGTTLCPGRHFATTEILAFIAMVVLRFDVVPIGDGGVWKEMKGEESLTAAMPKPTGEIDVEIRVRAEERGVEWTFGYSEGGKGFAIAAEDLGDELS